MPKKKGFLKEKKFWIVIRVNESVYSLLDIYAIAYRSPDIWIGFIYFRKVFVSPKQSEISGLTTNGKPVNDHVPQFAGDSM